jgi:hypothetical protein
MQVRVRLPVPAAQDKAAAAALQAWMKKVVIPFYPDVS